MNLKGRIISYSLDCIRQEPARIGARTWLLFLLLASWVYGLLVRMREVAYSSGWVSPRSLPIPVISVGNMGLGGTGKTPMVERIARRLSEGGKRVAVLLRGYQGSFSGEALVVSNGITPHQVGDEAFLLAKKLPSAMVIVGKDRFRAGERAVARQAEVLILDDGFQHRALRRDLDIVLVDASEPFGYGHLFPRGLLREPLTALARADILVITRGAGKEDLARIGEKFRSFNPHVPLFIGERRPLHWVKMPEDTRKDLEGMKGRRCLAFSGIANPSLFFSLLSSLGVEVARSCSFPDHHAYTSEELKQIVKWSQEAGAEALLTTEKDAVRLPAGAFPLKVPLFYLRIELALSQEEAFFSRLEQVIHRS